MHIRSRSLLKFTTAALILLGSFAAQAEPSYNASGPVLIRPFGDSITYGVGFLGPADAAHPERGWACPVFGTQTPNLSFQFPAMCQWPLAYGGGYRAWMTLYALQTGQFTFSTEGYQNSGSYWQQWLTTSHAHDGYPGARTDQLMAAANLASAAEVTLVHAGTNDIAQCIWGWTTCPMQQKTPTPDQVGTATFDSLVKLINTLLAKNANTHIFVAQIIPFAPAAKDSAKLNQAVTKYNSLIGNLSMNRVTVVNMNSMMDPQTDYVVDGIHPNSFGYLKMACHWVKAIQNVPAPCPGDTMQQLQQEMGQPPAGWTPPQFPFPGAPPGQ